MVNALNLMEFNFAELKLLDLSKAELIFRDKIEVSGAMIDTVFSWLEAHTVPDRGLLINKLHDYYYSFDAQLKMATSELFRYVAVARPDGQTRSLTQVAIDCLAKPNRNVEVRVFSRRDDACDWLFQRLGTAPIANT